ncbi:MAG: zinc-dependent metalloprotease [Gemmatimonadetes bacterium]|nr:zinc-dependent metalloprotease [Gemmatimonadota bacterium]
MCSPRTLSGPAVGALAALAALLLSPRPAGAQPAQGQGPASAIPTVEARTAGMRKLDGFFPLYWDSTAGHLYLEIARFNTEVMHIQGMGAGLGSNDIGVERGNLQGSEIVFFERQGPKVLLVEPNYNFRASSSRDPIEIKSVQESFARSVRWGFQVAAESPGRVLVDLTDYLLRDPNVITQRLRPGSYRVDPSRSSIYLPMTRNFPQNTELEVELTWVRQPPTGPAAGGFGGGGFAPLAGPGSFFEGVADVAADGEAASLRIHHSLVQLPDANYTPRKFDPRASFGSVAWRDYAAPPDGNEYSMDVRYIRRHRLKKQTPAAATSDPVRPIVYYLDPAVPEPQRSALLEGTGWWNQAFTAAGYRNALRVEIRPDSISPLDVRYNVINWVHRSTRGYSSGATVTDPRTGEIMKGLVTLGSLRYRQDYLIAEALLLPYQNGDEVPAEMREWAVARIRQLAAHEVGHTLGLQHNYYDSKGGRTSVMDYPHPYVTLKSDGTLDVSQVYERGIGEWDSVAINWGYQDFPPGTDEAAALQKILDDAWARDLRFLTNQDMSANPRSNQWSNGWDPAAELNRMTEIRRSVLRRWSEAAIRRGMPMAQMEEVLVPAYMYHAFQLEATASALGGLHYIYALRGDGRDPAPPVPAAEQRAALSALLATLKPSELALPDEVVRKLPPRPSGYPRSRELFQRYTGLTFDKISPAVAVANLAVGAMLVPDRAARMVEQQVLDPRLPGLQEVVDSLLSTVFNPRTANPYEAEIARAVQRVAVDRLMNLAATAPMPQVRAVATERLARKMNQLTGASPTTDADRAHVLLLSQDIKRFLDRPYAAYAPVPAVEPVRGDPIGDPGMEFFRRYDFERRCDWMDNGRWAAESCGR